LDGAEIVFDPRRVSSSTPKSEWLRARFDSAGRDVEWMGEMLSLSKATERLRDEYGADVNVGPANGFKYWCLASQPTKTLWELAEEQS